MWRVTENEIRMVVLENTADVEARDTSKALLDKYFHDPRKIDTVYEKIIERVQSDQTRNPFILLRSLCVLKKYLVYFMPSPHTITSIDRFCCSVTAIDVQTRNTLLYIRALLQRPKYRKEIPPSPASKKLRSKSALTTIGQINRISRSSWSSLGPKETRLHIQDAMIKSNCIISNHILFRKRSNYDSVLDKTGINGNFSRRTSSGSAEVFSLNPFLVGPKSMENIQERVLIEQKGIEERIQTVRLAKKTEEIAACRTAGIHIGRNNISMFQFKYYNEQEALVLSDCETESVIQSVVDPPNYETQLIGSKILIKILVDRFMADAESATNFFIYEIVSKMFASGKTETILHVFSILLNLSVHCNLWEDMSIYDEEGKFFSQKRHIVDVQGQLFNVLQQILIILLRYETDNSLKDPYRVWPAALNSLLYWTTKDGNFQRNMLSKVDIALLPFFLTYSISTGDFVQRHLIRILCSLLNVNGRLQVSQLKKVGGIHWIIDQYISIRSTEAMDNLFTVIYDYVVSTTFKKKGHRISDMYLMLFKRIYAPVFFTKFFQHMPDNFMDLVTQLFCEEEWNYSVSCDGVTEKIERKIFYKILIGFRSLCIEYLSLPNEFNDIMRDCKNSGNLVYLEEQLYSCTRKHQNFGKTILFQLLVENWIEKKNPSPLGRQTYELFTQLLDHKADFCHAIYVSIIDKVAVFLSCNAVNSAEQETLQFIISFLNEHLLMLFSVDGVSEEVTRCAFDVLFRYTVIQGQQSGNPYEESLKNDSLYSLFLQGSAIFPQQLKKGLDINIFGYLFDKITNKNYSEMRLAALLIMIEKCMDADNLEEIGGISFFRKLLASRDPAIAYHASRFLIDQLEAERPEDYKGIMSALLSKAQQSQNEHLVSNSYLQIMELIRGETAN